MYLFLFPLKCAQIYENTPGNIYLFETNNRNTRKRCEIVNGKNTRMTLLTTFWCFYY